MRKVIKLLVIAWLRFWAKVWLRRARPLFVAVGGSSGKTSTMAGIVAALRPVMRVRDAGQNTDIGVPLGILGMRIARYDARGWLDACLVAPLRALFSSKKCDACVAEYGIDHPGDMRRLVRMRAPDIAVLTSTGLEHAGYFSEETFGEVLEAIADEEMLLLESMGKDGVAVVPASDPRIASRLDRVRARIVTVGWEEGADCEVSRYAVSETGTEAELFYRNMTYPFSLPRPVTRAAVTSMALAACAAHEAGVPFREAVAAIARGGEVPPGRGRVLKGKRGALLIDSSYNATPEAVGDALCLLDDLGGQRRRVAILGDMRELGRHAREAHRLLADAVADACDLVLLVGPMMREHLAPVLAGRVTRVEAYPDVKGLLHDLHGLLEEGDAILIKGSQNTLFLERVTEGLLANPKDVAQLPRRGKRWDAARASAS